MISLKILPVILFVSTAQAQVLSVGHGGTGNTTLTSHGPLVGNGTGSITAIGPGTTGQCLISGGPSVDPVFAACPSGPGGGGITALTGDVIASGTGSVPATIANTTVAPGSYTNANITVNSQGRLTAASNGTAGIGAITLTGDVTGTGTGTVATTLGNTAVAPGSYTNTNLTVDSKGRITAASNGSSTGSLTALSDLSGATASRTIDNAAYPQQWRWNLGSSSVTGMWVNESAAATGNSILMEISTAPGSTATPLIVYAGNNGFFNFAASGELQARGNGARFVGPMVLTTPGNPGTAVAGAAALGTDSTGNIIPVTPGGGGAVYSARHANVALGAIGDLPLTGTSCSNGICTMVTPTADGMYRFEGTIIMASSPGGSCSPAGTVQLQISFTEAESSSVPNTNQLVAVRTVAASQTLANNMAMGNFTGANNSWQVVPYTVMAKNSNPISYKIAQTVASNGCTPQITANFRLFGPL